MTTPLYHAAARQDIELMQLLVARGADVNVTSATGYSPLLISLFQEPDRSFDKKKASAAALLLIARGADPNLTPESGTTPLSAAVNAGLTEVVRAMLDKGADPNLIPKGPGGSGVDQSPPLIAALVLLC